MQFLDELTRHLRFQVHDILQDPLPEKFDAVVVLNVLVHYAKKGREKILMNLHESLNDGGWLLPDIPQSNTSYGSVWDTYLGWLKDLSAFGFARLSSTPIGVSGNVYRKIQP